MRSLGIIILVLFGVHSVFARPIYVSPEGSDHNDGLTKDNPMQTIGAAIGCGSWRHDSITPRDLLWQNSYSKCGMDLQKCPSHW